MNNNNCTIDLGNNESYIHDYEPHTIASSVICGLFIPPFIFVGIIANIINIRIFTNADMRKAKINWFLAALSLVDFCIDVFSFFMFCLPAFSDLSKNANVVQNGHVIMKNIFPLALTAQTSSVLFTVAISAYRWFGVCFPFLSRQFCTGRMIKMSFALITIFSIAYNMSRFFEIGLINCWSEYFNQNVWQIAATPFRNNRQYQTYYLGYGYLITMFVIPFTLLIALNLSIMISVKRSIRSRCKMSILSKLIEQTSGNTRKENETTKNLKRVRTEERTTLMLVGVVTEFLIGNSLAFVSSALEMGINHGSIDITPEFLQCYALLIDLSNLLVVINSSTNIFIFLAFNKRFRQEFVSLLGRSRSSRLANHLSEMTVLLVDSTTERSTSPHRLQSLSVSPGGIYNNINNNGRKVMKQTNFAVKKDLDN